MQQTATSGSETTSEARVTASPKSDEFTASSRRSWLTLPRIFILLSTVLFAVSHIWEWWELRLNAPQYPGGLFVTVYTHDVRGDVREVDGLNHYIGMAPLAGAAELERTIAPFAIVLFIILGLVAVFLKNRWTPLLTVPIILFPFVMFADLYFWLYRFGNNLDPTAALSGAVEPFTPAILGRGTVGQFSTDAAMGFGWWVAVAAAVVAIAAIILSFRDKPENA